ATVRTQDGPFFQTTTNPSGQYVLSVTPGSYHVQVVASGYASQYNGGFTANFQAPFIAVANGSTATANFAMRGGAAGPANEQAGGFSGRVTDATLAAPNNGLGNVFVSVQLAAGGFVL